MTTTALARPAFDGLIARHRRALRLQVAAAGALLVFGLALVAAGFTTLATGLGGDRWLAWLLGLMVAAAAAFPAREALEHHDRASGLEFLRDEWHDLERADAPDPEAFERLAAVTGRLYPSDPAG